MPDAASQDAPSPDPAVRDSTSEDYPVREYIGSMAGQLAMMARWDGDEVLAGLLEAVVFRATGVRP